MKPVDRILVPTDFSEPAGAGLKWATMFARAFSGHVVLLHVVPEPYAYPWGSEVSVMPLTEILARSEKDSEEHLRRLAAETGLPADRVTTRVMIGSPVDQILETIAAERVDLVVVGTHGRGMVGHLLLGSVAERLVRRSPVPVLTVHGEARASDLTRDALATARN